MRQIWIGGIPLPVKDTVCEACGDFFAPFEGETCLVNEAPKLWLYVNVTNRCNAGCPFCVNPRQGCVSDVDPARYETALRLCRESVSGVSFTGGEPMLYPELLEELIAVTDSLLPRETELDLVTNGTNLERLSVLKGIGRLSTIHISRHAAEDETNSKLMRFPGAPGKAEIAAFLSRLHDPDAVVFNCVLQKDGVSSMAEVADYLDHAISLHIRNTSFITMFLANAYCRGSYVSPYSMPVVSDLGIANWNRAHDSEFSVWNRMHDHDFCRCLSGDYRNKSGCTRYYFRCPAPESGPDYCRQLVFTAENQLQDGFGTDRTVLL